jgi:intracellular multiplication protein IcmP
MQGQQQQQQGPSQDNSLDLLWIAGGVICAIVIIWYVFKPQIISGIFQIRLYEINLIDFAFELWSKGLSFVGISAQQATLQEWLIFIKKNKNGVGIAFSTVADLSQAVGYYFRYPLMIFSCLIAWIIYFNGSTRNFHHTFNTVTLKQYEQNNWPQIKPVVNLDLVKQNLDQAPWAMAMSPMKFCKKYKLLEVESKYGKYSATLKKSAAHRILSLQLGPLWTSPKELPLYLKALFAIFAARINADMVNSTKLLEQISKSAASSGNFDFSGVEKILRKNMYTKEVLKLTYLHGYVTTVLASMLMSARAFGVLASSEFIWLKPIDRRMWYMLNSVGRITAVSEISGAFAHWLAEKKLGLPIISPMVEEAVRGLELALNDIVYKPDDE